MSNSQYPSLGYVMIDGVVLLTTIICAMSSIFCEFSNIKTLNQFNKLGCKNQLHFSIGKTHKHLRYFFELTLWNLWLGVVAYIVIWDMLTRRLLLRNKKLPTFQRIMNRILVTFALGIGFIYWLMLGVPQVLKHRACLFKLVNTFGLHCLIIMATLAYYLARNRADLENEKNKKEESKPTENKSDDRIIKRLDTDWKYSLLFFYLSSIVFSGLSYALQFDITHGTPVYDGIVDWHHPLIAGTVCFISPLIFTSIFYIMHIKNKHTLHLRGLILTFTVACMSFTLSYGLFDNCLHYPSSASWGISLSMTIILSLGTFALYHLNKDKNFDTVFPPFLLSSGKTHKDHLTHPSCIRSR